MAKVYYDLIIKGLREINNVPLKWREEVQVLLESDK